MKLKNAEFIKVLDGMLDKELDELSELLEILGADDSITDSEDLEGDLLVIKNKKNMLKNFKGMIVKASVKVDGLDNEIMMNKGEKKVFYRLMKTIMFFRKIFRRK